MLLEKAPRDHTIELTVVDDEDLQQAALAVLALTCQLAQKLELKLARPGLRLTV